MKKILVTGAAGFIGSHLTELCASQGYQVKAMIHYNSKNSWGWLEESRFRDQIKIVAGDIRDYDSVYSSLKGCDTVFHLAALIGIPYSYVSPLAYVKTNIEGTYNILQAGRELGLKEIIISSTSETYGTAQYVPIDEKHPLQGQSPYAASKIGADQLTLSYFRSFGLPVKIARPFNTYGPRQSARAIIPTIITQILSGKKTIQLGNLSPTRDFTFVEDTAAGFLAIAKSKKLFGEVTNIGMKNETSIVDLVKLIARLANQKVEIIKDHQRMRPGDSEVERLVCNNKKIKSATSWRPEEDLKSGLKKTIHWMEQHRNVYKADLYTL